VGLGSQLQHPVQSGIAAAEKLISENESSEALAKRIDALRSAALAEDPDAAEFYGFKPPKDKEVGKAEAADGPAEATGDPSSGKLAPELEQALRLTRNRDKAQDLTQDTFERCVLRLPTAVPAEKVVSWMLVVMRHLFLDEPFLVPGALQAEGPRLGGSSSRHLRNHVGAPHPVSLGQVGGRPLRRMVRMGVVETHDFQTLLPYLLLNSNKLLRINGIAIPWRIASKVIARDRRNGDTSAIPEPPG